MSKKIEWTSQEEEILKKLHAHYGSDFDKIAGQMNNIFQYLKMTPELVEYRWKYYLDPNINRLSLNLAEEDLLFELFMKSDKMNSQFWFSISSHFKQRTPSVLKDQFSRLIQLCLSKMNIMFGNKETRKRYSNRIKLLSIDCITSLFRLSTQQLENRGYYNNVFEESIYGCQKLSQYVQNMLQHRIHLITDHKQLQSQYTEDCARDYKIIMETIIFVDTMFRIQFQLKPYSDKQDDNTKNQSGPKLDMINHEEYNNAMYYNDKVFEPLNSDQIKIIRRSEIQKQFKQLLVLNPE